MPGVLAPHSIPPPSPARPALRVLSLPDDHPYVRHSTTLSAPGDARTAARRHPVDGPDALEVLGDGTHPWAPSAAFVPGWIAAHADRFDLVHLHFGFEAADARRLAEWVTELHAAGKPLVFTVHDLRSPHQRDRRALDAQLDVLVPAADAVLTLTAGAATEIGRRWGRPATVLAHPHIVPLDHLDCGTGAHDGITLRRQEGLVGVHLKGLRANVVDPVDLVGHLATAVGAAGGRLRVDLHRPDSDHHRAVADDLGRAASGRFELRIHPRFTDAELYAYLSTLHVSVLPYRFGTHSGWVEACRDLGTAVVAPEVGYYAEQWPALHRHRVDAETGADPASLAAAIADALAGPPPPPADPVWRRDQRRALVTAHLGLYRRVLGAA